MKLYKPLFSIIVIVFQLIFSLKDSYKHQDWQKANPELDGLIEYYNHDTLVLYVLIIGIFEMLTKPSWFKILIRVLLICVVFGYQLSGVIPINDFGFGVYYTAEFSAVLALVMILFRMGKFGVEKIIIRN